MATGNNTLNKLDYFSLLIKYSASRNEVSHYFIETNPSTNKIYPFLFLFQGLLAMFFILAENENPVVESIGFLPILALVLFIVKYNWGLGPLPWAVMSELFPIEVKVMAAPITTTFCSILAFLITR